MGLLYLVFRWVVYATVTGGVLAGLILLAKRLAGDRLGARWHYFIWFLLLVRLAVPVLPASPVSLYNLLHVDRVLSETFPATGHAAPAVGAEGASGSGAGGGAGSETGPESSPNGSPDGSAETDSRTPRDPAVPAPSSSTGDRSPLPHSWPGQAVTLVLCAWLAGVATFAALLTAAEIRFRSKAAQARRAVDPRLLALFAAAKRRAAVENVSLWESDAVGSPVTFGLLRPRLLLPVAMADRLDDEQLTNIFLHELAHVRRQDIAVNWLSAGLRTLHWFNPLVWYGLGRMREDQEVSCDALVLAHLEPGAARGYGRTVIDLLQIASAPPTIPSAAAVRSSAALNRRRLTMIALFKKPSLKWTLLGLALAVLIAGVALTNGLAPASHGVPAVALSGVRAVKMASERVGWVLTGSAVLRTDDGGGHWTERTPPEAAASTTGAGAGWSSGCLATVGGDTAYVTFAEEGSTSIFVFGTSDAGRTWTRAEIAQEADVWSGSAEMPAPPVTALQFADADHGWLLASYGVALGSQAMRVYATADAGATWQLVDDVTREPLAAGSLPLGGLKTGLAFADASRGWVSGLDYGNEVFVYRTQDGGRTWAREPIAAPAGYSVEGGSAETRAAIFFGDAARQGLVPADGFLPVVFRDQGQPTIFYATHDLGVTWEPTTAVVSAANNSFVWSFADPQHGFATDSDKLYVTADGAASWQAVTPNISLQGTTWVDFVSPETGWAVVSGSLVKTTDGGRTWTAGDKSGQASAGLS